MLETAIVNVRCVRIAARQTICTSTSFLHVQIDDCTIAKEFYFIETGLKHLWIFLSLASVAEVISDTSPPPPPHAQEKYN